MNFIPQSWGDLVALIAVIGVVVGIIKKVWLISLENQVNNLEHTLKNKVQTMESTLTLYATREVVDIKFLNLEKSIASIDTKMDILLGKNNHHVRQSNP